MQWTRVGNALRWLVPGANRHQVGLISAVSALDGMSPVSCQPHRRMHIAKGLKKSTKLRRMLESPDLEFLMEAHSGISARIVEETGFRGIWASGLAISAQLGVRDSNEASWTQIVDVLEFMNDAAPNTPILVDADTGYGNFNNARRLIRKLEDRHIAGVCIEDKEFPKRNSLLSSQKQPLADVEEFALKIRACKETQRDPDFVVVARVEAFIAGHGLEEALLRATAYSEAGADAILMHSKRSDSSEIDAFMANWNNTIPVVIVPTKYHSVPTYHIRKLGVSVAIWANHNIRASVLTMQKLCQLICAEQSIANAEKMVAPVNEIFRLQNEDELKAAEKRYLPSSAQAHAEEMPGRASIASSGKEN